MNVRDYGIVFLSLLPFGIVFLISALCLQGCSNSACQPGTACEKKAVCHQCCDDAVWLSNPGRDIWPCSSDTAPSLEGVEKKQCHSWCDTSCPEAALGDEPNACVSSAWKSVKDSRPRDDSKGSVAATPAPSQPSSGFLARSSNNAADMGMPQMFSGMVREMLEGVVQVEELPGMPHHRRHLKSHRENNKKKHKKPKKHKKHKTHQKHKDEDGEEDEDDDLVDDGDADEGEEAAAYAHYYDYYKTAADHKTAAEAETHPKHKTAVAEGYHYIVTRAWDDVEIDDEVMVIGFDDDNDPRIQYLTGTKVGEVEAIMKDMFTTVFRQKGVPDGGFDNEPEDKNIEPKDKDEAEETVVDADDVSEEVTAEVLAQIQAQIDKSEETGSTVDLNSVLNQFEFEAVKTDEVPDPDTDIDEVPDTDADTDEVPDTDADDDAPDEADADDDDPPDADTGDDGDVPDEAVVLHRVASEAVETDGKMVAGNDAVSGTNSGEGTSDGIASGAAGVNSGDGEPQPDL